MYWVWSSEPTADNEATIHGSPAVVEELDLEFDNGLFISTSLPPIEIIRGGNEQGALADNLCMSSGNGLLLCSRLRQVLADIGVDNVQFFPVSVRDPKNGTETDDYSLANIVGRVACLDLRNSVLTMSPEEPDRVEFIEVLAINEASANGFDLFRLHEDPQVILASERVKSALESHRITGVRFYKAAKYPF